MASRQLIWIFFLAGLVFFYVPAGADPAVVTEEGAAVYVLPNFDAQAITALHEGDRIEVSKKSFGPLQFHRVRLTDGRMGFMPDNQFKIGAPPPKAPSKPAKKTDERPHQKSFTATKYRGFTLDEVEFRENTMGLTPTAMMTFYGFKLLGPDLFFEGDTVTEFNLNISPSAPKYYQQATGNAASGWILRTDYMMDATFPESRRILTYLGIGPMLRYSSFQVALNSGGSNTNSYGLTDIVLGLAANAGIGFRFESMALRVEYKLYWDRVFMNDIQMAFLFPF